MKEKAQWCNDRHQYVAENLNYEDDCTEDYRDDKAIEEDECVHDSVFLRVNKYIT